MQGRYRSWEGSKDRMGLRIGAASVVATVRLSRVPVRPENEAK